MKNTRYSQATGGTDIKEWLPNQIRCVLGYQEKIMLSIEDFLANGACIREENKNSYMVLKESLVKKKRLLEEQSSELKKNEYDVDVVYGKNVEYSLEDKEM
jgi:hypothetical protein